MIAADPTFGVDRLERELEEINLKFNDESALRIKTIEKTTNHDLKSVEYYIKERIQGYNEYVHFCCTSEDINNLAYSLMMRDAMKEVMLPVLEQLEAELTSKSAEWAEDAMLARTHGQPATPTTLGKEYANFAYRLSCQLGHIRAVRLKGKINGAVGNYNAHYFAYPQVDWMEVCR